MGGATFHFTLSNSIDPNNTFTFYQPTTFTKTITLSTDSDGKDVLSSASFNEVIDPEINITHPQTTSTTKVNTDTKITLQFSSDTNPSDNIVLQTSNGKITLNVPADFQVSQVQAGNLQKSSLAFTQSAAGQPLTIQLDNNFILANNSILNRSQYSQITITGQYKRTAPTVDETVSASGGTLEYLFGNEPKTGQISSYQQTIIADSLAPDPGRDLRHYEAGTTIYLSKQKDNAELFSSSFSSHMSAANSNLGNVGHYTNIQFTDEFSDGIKFGSITGFNDNMNGQVVTVTYRDGTTARLTVTNNQVQLDSNKFIRTIEYTVPAMTADYQNNLHFNGKINNIRSDGTTVNPDDQFSLRVNAVMAGQTLYSGTAQDTVADYGGVVLQFDFMNQLTQTNADRFIITANPLQPFSPVINNSISSNPDFSRVEATTVDNPQFWFVLPEPANGTYGFLDSSHQGQQTWNISVSRVGSQYVIHATHHGNIALANFNEALADLPDEFGSGENFINKLYDDGHLYFTADNFSQLLLHSYRFFNVGGLIGPSPVTNLPGQAGMSVYDIQDFSGQTSAASGFFGTNTAAGNVDSGVYQSNAIAQFNKANQLSYRLSLNNYSGKTQNNAYAVINLPTTVSDTTFAFTPTSIQVIDPTTNQAITGAIIKVSTKAPSLIAGQKPDLSNFHTVSATTDWSAIKSLYVLLPNMNDGQQAWIYINGQDASGADLIPDIGKSATLTALEGTDSIAVGGTVTLHFRMHYQDADGNDHYITMPDQQATIGDQLVHVEPMNQTSCLPDGYNFKQDDQKRDIMTAINGQKTWVGDEPNETVNTAFNSKLQYYADDDTIQYELVPTKEEQLKVVYVDTSDPTNNKILKTETFTGRGRTDLTADNQTTLNNDYQGYLSQHYTFDTNWYYLVENGQMIASNVNNLQPNGDGTSLSLQNIQFPADETTGNTYYVPLTQVSQVDDEYYSIDIPTGIVVKAHDPANSIQLNSLNDIVSSMSSSIIYLLNSSNLQIVQDSNGQRHLLPSSSLFSNLSNLDDSNSGVAYKVSMDNGILTISFDFSNLKVYGVPDHQDDNGMMPWYDTTDSNGNNFVQTDSTWFNGATHSIAVNLNELYNLNQQYSQAQNNGDSDPN